MAAKSARITFSCNLNDPDSKLVYDFLDALGTQRTPLILQLIKGFLNEQGIDDVANMTVAELSQVKDLVREKTSSNPRRRSTPRKKVEKPVVPVVVEEEPEEEPELEQSSTHIPAPTPIVEEILESSEPVAEEFSEPIAPESEVDEADDTDDYVNPELLAGLDAFGF
jgi:hypothetical protein